MTKPTTNPAGTRGYVYIRTSKDEQDKRSQKERVQRWLDSKELTATWLEDSGARDLSAKRPNFQRLLSLVQDGAVDWVIVAERDRLGFRDAYEYGHFVHLFRSNGVQLWSVADNRDLTGDDRIEPILASLEADKSQHEQKGFADRTLRAKIAATKRGEWVGGKAPYGYDLVAKTQQGVEIYRLVYEAGHYRRIAYYPDGTSRRYDGKNNVPSRDRGVTVYAEISRNTETAGWVRKIYQWYLEGIGVRTIAGMLNELKVPALYSDCWLGPTICHILCNPIYTDGVPSWNKQGGGRFLEVIGGQQVAVPRVNGVAVANRVRKKEDHIRCDTLRPENAIIDRDTWEKAQARTAAIQATPKAERRPRSSDQYFTGLLECGDCKRLMSTWAQVDGYRCSLNAKYSKLCRCNRTSHELIEEVVIEHLSRSETGISWLRDNADQCADYLFAADGSDALTSEFVKGITALWRRAKKEGRKPDGKAWDLKTLRKLYGTTHQKKATQIEADIKAKTAERDRLVKRMGLLDDEGAAVAAVRVNELSRELAVLREQVKPQEDRLDEVRRTLGALLEQHRQVRDCLERSLPKQKGEAVRRVISRIVVVHEERVHGKQRRSEVVEVKIFPHVGPAASFRHESSRVPAR